MHDFYRDSLGQLGATRGSGESGYDGEGGGGNSMKMRCGAEGGVVYGLMNICGMY